MKTRSVWIATSILCALAIFGCSKKGSEQPPQPPPPTAVVSPATAGTITGTVRLEGEPPKFHPIDMSAEPACVKANPKPVIPPIVVTGEHGALANAAVYIKSGLGRYKFDVPQTPVVLNQKGCMYEPRVLAVRVGQPLEVHNDDPTVHNINVRATVNHSWNRSEEPGEPPFTAEFKHPELYIPISCNVHPWMRAYLFVFGDPYYDITTTTGDFSLKGLPPGTYTIEAWQELYGVQDQTVTLGPKETKHIDFVFKAQAAK
ncbi:MAG: carboxypeptidase regulatory-like domain-containing protein [Candidatus Acidiferrales bacterium]